MPHSTRRSRQQRVQQRKSVNSHDEKRAYAAGPLAFFITLFIVAIGAIQLISTMHAYALSVAELNSLKNQEAELVRQQEDLKEQIARWNDPVFVASKAREELGFIFPGEQPIRVLNADQVPGVNTSKGKSTVTTQENRVTLPWYNELLYSIQKADALPAAKTLVKPDSPQEKTASQPGPPSQPPSESPASPQ